MNKCEHNKADRSVYHIQGAPTGECYYLGGIWKSGPILLCEECAEKINISDYKSSLAIKLILEDNIITKAVKEAKQSPNFIKVSGL